MIGDWSVFVTKVHEDLLLGNPCAWIGLKWILNITKKVLDCSIQNGWAPLHKHYKYRACAKGASSPNTSGIQTWMVPLDFRYQQNLILIIQGTENLPSQLADKHLPRYWIVFRPRLGSLIFSSHGVARDAIKNATSARYSISKSTQSVHHVYPVTRSLTPFDRLILEINKKSIYALMKK